MQASITLNEPVRQKPDAAADQSHKVLSIPKPWAFSALQLASEEMTLLSRIPVMAKDDLGYAFNLLLTPLV